MQKVQICLADAEKMKELVEQITKIKGNYVIDTGKEKVSIETVKTVLEMPDNGTLKLLFDSEDTNFLLEISDYLQIAE